MRTDKARVHRNCGGLIVDGVCTKCGEKQKGLLKKIFGEGPLIERDPKFNPKKYKERIRRGDDIFKD